MNNGDNDEAKVTDDKGQTLSAENKLFTEGDLKVNNKINYDRVKNGDNNETKVTDGKE